MSHLYRDHRLYLAERMIWLDNYVRKTSQRAIIKVESLKAARENGAENIDLIEELVIDSLLIYIPHGTILDREGYFKSNLKN